MQGVVPAPDGEELPSMHQTIVKPPLSLKARRAPPTVIVLHATAGTTARSSVDWLRSQGLGYHFIIARDAKDSASSVRADLSSEPAVFACVAVQHRVGHTGSTIPAPGTDDTHNQRGVAISLANRQNGEPYTPKQLVVLDALIGEIRSKIPTIRHLTTHAVIQPWNRKDPLAVDAKALAAKHGLTFFTPTAKQIADHKPKKTPRPK
jgi:N-acetyl-anhydromuramyl-L-alanine amidase AmpD